MSFNKKARLALLASCGVLALFSRQALAADTASAPTTNLGAVGTTDSSAAEAPPSATGSREQAKELKKDAPNIIEVQPFTEIEKLPDVNLAEALQRVPGISLESDTGEGRFINIRGMDADLNGTTYDGVRLTPSNQSSPLGGARAVAFDAFPSGLVGGVEVVKTLTPDIDAEGLGGVVNLLPRTLSADGAPFVDASVGAGIETLRPTAVVKGDITAGTSFGIGNGTAPWDIGPFSNDRPFGIVATFARYDDERGIDDVEEDYSDTAGIPNKALADQQMRWYQYHRSRQGGGGELTFTPDDANNFFIRALDSGYEEQVDKHRLELDGLDGSNGSGIIVTNPNGSFSVPDASAIEQFTNSDELVENRLFEAGGHSVIHDALKLDYHVAWTEGTDEMVSNYADKFKGPGSFALTYNNTNPAAETYSATGVNLANPSLYKLKKVTNAPYQDMDKEWSGAVDATVPLSLADYEGQAKFGVNIRLRTRSDNQDQTTYVPTGTVTVADLQQGGDQIYYNGLYNIGPTINNNALNAVHLIANDPLDDYIANQEAFQHDSENVYAGYGMYTVQVDKLNLLGGVRIEATDATYKANVGTTTPAGVTLITPTASSTDYVDAFPSFQAKYNLSDRLIARADFSTAIARPGFNQITAAKTIDYTQNAISQGNPNLKPTTGINFDASVEYYLPKGGIVSFGAFDKEFDNYIVPTEIFVSNYANTGEVFSDTNFKNIQGASVQGIELQYTQEFQFLAAPFDGFGIDSNYTYNHSRGEIRPGEYEPLPSTSPQNFNVALFYEKYGAEFRVAASYVSRDLFGVGGSRDTDVFASPRFRLDIGTGYAITEHLKLSFDAKNLTNTPLEFTESEVASRPIQREFYDQTYLFGLRYSY
jgi:TonB-dependent receptor